MVTVAPTTCCDAGAGQANTGAQASSRVPIPVSLGLAVPDPPLVDRPQEAELPKARRYQVELGNEGETAYHPHACALMHAARTYPMPSLQIRDLPDDVYQALAFRAQQEHRSLAQQAVTELRRIPTLTAGERRRLVIARIRGTIPEPEIPLTPSPEELVREDRER